MYLTSSGRLGRYPTERLRPPQPGRSDEAEVWLRPGGTLEDRHGQPLLLGAAGTVAKSTVRLARVGGRLARRRRDRTGVACHRRESLGPVPYANPQVTDFVAEKVLEEVDARRIPNPGSADQMPHAPAPQVRAHEGVEQVAGW